MSESSSRLLKPLRIGHLTLNHRIGLAPLTRLRATSTHLPSPLMLEYYSQRACTPGTLLITEGTFISPSSRGGFSHSPGIWSAEQIVAWRGITDEVHRRGCFIFCQLFAMGRAADGEVARREGVSVVGPSAVGMGDGAAVPREMTREEIARTVGEFAGAARNAIEAGFDGVEVHGANGYLVDQFIQDVSNHRDDEYGGSVEGRSRFVDEVMRAVVAAVGAERVGLRLSPWSAHQGMGMRDPIPQFSDVIDKARRLDLAYLHLIESRISGDQDRVGGQGLGFAYERWGDRPMLVAGGYTLADARRLVDEERGDRDVVVMFGRHFIANPDLVYRFREGLELGKYERATFYTYLSPKGYVDYPYSEEFLAAGKGEVLD